MTDYRAHFDADVEFVNGGRLNAEGFRLDLLGPNPSDEEIGELFIQHLGLALVRSVELQISLICNSRRWWTCRCNCSG